MTRQEAALQARRELDRRFEAATIEPLRTRPHRGWIRAIRGALGMSQANLAVRLGVSPPAVAQLERSERAGGITVGKLSQVAAALDCTLVYALIPNGTIEEAVMRRARQVAAERLGYVAGTMALEDQALPHDRDDEHLDSAARDIIASGSLWNDEDARRGPHRR